ncbi:hypothetical protein [Amycolatopsis sp. cmx-4-54]|uniref:hypothetical protein n=1 Tax=Amycolatopsis sp. cmx-4-54 TaxID=2790936 RepID=UPI00397AEDB7
MGDDHHAVDGLPAGRAAPQRRVDGLLDGFVEGERKGAVDLRRAPGQGSATVTIDRN